MRARAHLATTAAGSFIMSGIITLSLLPRYFVVLDNGALNYDVLIAWLPKNLGDLNDLSKRIYWPQFRCSRLRALFPRGEFISLGRIYYHQQSPRLQPKTTDNPGGVERSRAVEVGNELGRSTASHVNSLLS